MQKPTRPACLFLLGPCHTPHQLLAFHTHPGLSLWFSSSIGSYRKKMMSFHVPGNGPYVPSRLLVPATASSLSSGPFLYRLTLLFSPPLFSEVMEQASSSRTMAGTVAIGLFSLRKRG